MYVCIHSLISASISVLSLSFTMLLISSFNMPWVILLVVLLATLAVTNNKPLVIPGSATWRLHYIAAQKIIINNNNNK